MTELDASGGFDVHDYRHGLKLLKQDRETTYLDNREGFECPACGRAFDRLFVSEKDEVVFDSAPNGPICLVRAPAKLLVLTH
jgi:hypothetical protein